MEALNNNPTDNKTPYLHARASDGYIKPRKFTPDEFGKLIDAYIAKRLDEKLPISRIGLAVYINSTTGKHVSSNTITEYDDIDEYREHIKRLDDASYVFTVDCMFTKSNPAGPIFFAKNVHNMADVQKLDVSGSIIHTMQISQDRAEELLAEAMESRRQRLAATTVEGEYEVKN